MQMKTFRAFLAFIAFIFAGAWNMGWAQQVNAPVPRGAPSAIVPESEQEIDPSLASGPTIYVVDRQGRLATINLGTYAVHFIGRMGATLTDIGFSPTNHQLYGVSFNAFYAVNKTTAKATFIGNLGVNDANALVFNSRNVAYSAGVNSGKLYKINVSTGQASFIGSMGGFSSAGDLTFYNGYLMLAGFKGCCDPSKPNYLVALNESTGAAIGSLPLECKEIFGLVSTGRNELFGLGIVPPGTTPALFKIVPSNPIGHRCELLKNTLGEPDWIRFTGLPTTETISRNRTRF
jgi:hypothetical protein